MSKSCAKIALIFFSMLLVLGFIYCCFNGFDGNFIPSLDIVKGWLRSFPNINSDINSCLEVFNGTSPSNFLEQVGAFFTIIWYVISAPFRVIGWLFSFFGLSNS